MLAWVESREAFEDGIVYVEGVSGSDDSSEKADEEEKSKEEKRKAKRKKREKREKGTRLEKRPSNYWKIKGRILIGKILLNMNHWCNPIMETFKLKNYVNAEDMDLCYWWSIA